VLNKWKGKMDSQWYPDAIPENEYQEQQRAVIAEALRVAHLVAYNHKIRYAYKRVGRAIHPMEWLLGFPLWVEIIWARRGGLPANCKRPVVSDERIFVIGKPKAWHDLRVTTVWRIAQTPQGNGHPCPFPLEIPKLLIESYTDPGDLVMDPYMGSGTTAVAARDVGRQWAGCDIDPGYVEIANRRIGAAPPVPGTLFSESVKSAESVEEQGD
jgi:modification methylase